MNNFLKSLVTALAQSGGDIRISLTELSEAGVELSLTNISLAERAELTLRLGPKIYYVPQVAQEGQSWTSNHNMSPPPPASPSSLTRSSAEVERLVHTSPPQSILDQEIEAVNRVSNLPPSRPQPLSYPSETELMAQELTDSAPSEGHSFPKGSPAGTVKRLDDLSSFLAEENIRQRNLRRQEKLQKQEAFRENNLPFRNLPR